MKVFLLLILLTASVNAEKFHIFSISQEVSMGYPGEQIKKDYFVNLGSTHGLRKGDILNVFRNIARIDQYTDKKRYSHMVKIGELRIIHTEDSSAIARNGLFKKDENDQPNMGIPDFMVGDFVDVKVN